ncbi:gamma-glutamyltransferase 5a [Chanos chanos]|uniref:Glutathione hydrolase n=1 Tax=Chanos chanos TaxID=29144 RepID=A0A6J2VPZ4_CHACN|nr:glutathione hydrolase 5 proenzyme-like [Chanos chanos]
MARPRDRLCRPMCVCFAVVCVVIIIIVCATHYGYQRCSGEVFRRAAVAADSETCSKVGRDILQSGGSAVDGAIAALLCTSIINPQSMGIGGGSIFTVLEKNGTVKIINSRETVPKDFKADLLSECPQQFKLMSGSQWIGVPGEIRGYAVAHGLYGKLPWASLFMPTIKMAREGFPIPYMLSQFISRGLNKSTPLGQLFVDENGNQLKEGDTIKFEKLANTLEIIAEKGPDAFYTGDIAKDLISDIRDAGGSVSLEDLSSFTVTEPDVWELNLGEYQMFFPPPPAGGAILGFILNVMRGYNLGPASLEGKQKSLTYQRYVETCKFANSLKRYTIDPRFSSERKARQATEEAFAERIRQLISDSSTHDAQYYNVTPYLDGMGTTHVSVLAEDGMAVSVTSTINHIFGSQVFSPKTGIILNNELSDFCGKTDQIHAGEQPPSSMAPVILYSKSKQHTLVMGGSGGSMITTGMALTIMNHLWFGKSLEESIAAPVVFVDSKNALKFEPKFDKAVVEELRALGHTIKEQSIFYNVINVVSKRGGCIRAISDARKMGRAAGY